THTGTARGAYRRGRSVRARTGSREGDLPDWSFSPSSGGSGPYRLRHQPPGGRDVTQLLDVWFGETKAGTLSQDETGALGYAYDPGYLAGREPRAISFSMPLQEEPYADRIVRPFFSGLLPDEGARQRLAGALGISAGNAFGLLEVIGGECAG